MQLINRTTGMVEYSGTVDAFRGVDAYKYPDTDFEFEVVLTASEKSAKGYANANANVIVKVFNVDQGTIMSFDNLKLTLSGNNCQIATEVGAEKVAILSEHEYPGGSFAAHTGGVGKPVAVTPKLQNVGDTGFVEGERATLTIANFTTSKLYRACVWMHSAAGGNWSGWVEEI